MASLPEAIVAERAHADLGGLSAAVDAAIESLDGFVKNELHSLREVSALEIDDILAERQRLIEDATSVGRRHIDEASAHAERIVNKARKEGDRMRQQVEQELREERERFEQSLADRDAQAQARVNEILEQRRGPPPRGRRAGGQRRAGTGLDAGVVRAGPQLADPGRGAEQDLARRRCRPCRLTRMPMSTTPRPQLDAPVAPFRLNPADSGEPVGLDDLIASGPVVLALIEGGRADDPRAAMLRELGERMPPRRRAWCWCRRATRRSAGALALCAPPSG